MTKMLIGANPFGGFSHQNKARDEQMRNYHTPERIIETWNRAWKAGCTIREIPIAFTDRVAGYSKITPGIAVESVKIALRLRFRRGGGGPR